MKRIAFLMLVTALTFSCKKSTSTVSIPEVKADAPADGGCQGTTAKTYSWKTMFITGMGTVCSCWATWCENGVSRSNFASSESDCAGIPKPAGCGSAQ